MDADTLLDHRLFAELDRIAEKDEEALDAIMAHGFLTAQAISPAPDSPEEIAEQLVDLISSRWRDP